uniref:Pre-rRNA-processing protein TSR1 homolog n=1 Tax=Canis lupus familiaris TaxID=9615 RepID=A0A8C0RA86_CANLF
MWPWWRQYMAQSHFLLHLCCFSKNSNGMHSLIATGYLLSVDPDRMVIKRVVLSGHPFKIFTKMAVLHYMFFSREDVLRFKPVKLRTKAAGDIKEPLGTHGHMKCSFDGKLKSQDTVLMNLYKRVFPKWTYDPYVPDPVPWMKKPHLNFILCDCEDIINKVPYNRPLV